MKDEHVLFVFCAGLLFFEPNAGKYRQIFWKFMRY